MKTIFIVRDGKEVMPLVLYCQRVGLKYNTALSRVFRAGMSSKNGIVELKINQNLFHKEILSKEMKPRGRKHKT